MIFRQLFDYETWTYTYLLADPASGEAVLVDTVKEQVERDLSLLRDLGLRLKYVLETHVHADHVTGAGILRQRTGAKVGVSAVAGVDCADIQVTDGMELSFGPYKLRAIATPGHTNTCTSFSCEGRVLTGDVLFIRDAGRTDFQQGSNERMYESITKKLFSLPDSTQVFPGHDYKGLTSSTIGEEKAHNSKVGGQASYLEFCEKMAAMKLGQPKKIHIAVPANLRCGLE
jgi:sulfur dioxygenase